jgi:hypothetical protein
VSGALTLAELVDFCIEHDIDQTKVTFGFGCKEVYACFTEEDYEKFAKSSDQFETDEDYDTWLNTQEWSSGEWDYSIRIY